MGNKGSETPKFRKPSPEQPLGSHPGIEYPDWAAFQAYYNAPGSAPAAPPVAFPLPPNAQGHPYMWGPQMFPPYGAPQFVAMYPPGALYPPHPSLQGGSQPYSPYAITSTSGAAEASVPVASGTKVEGRPNERKGRHPPKRSRRSLGSEKMSSEKLNGTRKASDVATDAIVSQSGESGTEDSSEGSDSNSHDNSHQEQAGQHADDGAKIGGHSGGIDGAKEVQPPHFPPIMNQPMPWMVFPGMPGTPSGFNIGAETWTGSATPKSSIRRRRPASASTADDAPSSLALASNGVLSDGSLQDDKVMKKEKRKQSNRESARRSRLRKLAETEELAQSLVTLKEENDSLKEALRRAEEECLKLASDNASLTEKLQSYRC